MDTNPLLVHCVTPPPPPNSSNPGQGLVEESFTLVKTLDVVTEPSFGSDGSCSEKRNVCLYVGLLLSVFMRTRRQKDEQMQPD